MNTFANALKREATVSYTENGDETFDTSLSALVDFFFHAPAKRADKAAAVKLFSDAWRVDRKRALQLALWLRDVRGGAGERELFRAITKWLSVHDTAGLNSIMHLIPIVGRFDDLYKGIEGMEYYEAIKFYADVLIHANGLALKWAPREKSANKKHAAAMRAALGLSASEYRKYLAFHSSTLEQKMSAKKWNEIEYSKLPSVAIGKYVKAFYRNDQERFEEFKNKLTKGEATINADALYPYNISSDETIADAQWKALPDFVSEDISFLPMIDTSGSMQAEVSSGLTAMFAASALGLYLAEHNKSAFKDIFVSFSTSPSLETVREGESIHDKIRRVYRTEWGMSTNLDAAMKLVLAHAIKHSVLEADMPDYLVVLSDMEFNSGSGYYKTSSVKDRTKARFEELGYKVPTLIWWNIMSRGDTTPVHYDESGQILLGGLSPAVFKNVLNGTTVTPESVMLQAISDTRYEFELE